MLALRNQGEFQIKSLITLLKVKVGPSNLHLFCKKNNGMLALRKQSEFKIKSVITLLKVKVGPIHLHLFCTKN